MRAHALVLSVVSFCVVVLAERAGENRPISNLQLLTPRLSPPPTTSAATNDNVQIVKWLLGALHRYLYENGADDLAEISREPEFIIVVVERADEGEGDAEQQEDNEDDDEDLPPMLPYVERDHHENQRTRDFRHPYTPPRSQKRYKPYDDQEQRFQEYLQDLLVAEERDDYDEDQSQTVQNYHNDPEPLLSLEELQPGHRMKQLPADVQKVALQAHLENEKGCTWCALLRTTGLAPPKPPSASPPTPTPQKQKLAAALPDPWFGKLNGRKWSVLHEDYPGMMQQMMNLALDHRERRFRTRWSKQTS